MEITHHLVAEDYIQFNLFQVHHSDQLRKRLHVQRWVMTIVFILIGLVAFNLLTRFRTLVLLVFLLISVFWYVYFPTFSEKQVIRSTEKKMAHGQLTNLFDEVKIQFDEEGIKEITTQGTYVSSWKEIESMKMTPEYLYIYLTKESAIIIPKRTLTAEEVVQLEALLQNYYPKDLQYLEEQEV